MAFKGGNLSLCFRSSFEVDIDRYSLMLPLVLIEPALGSLLSKLLLLVPIRLRKFLTGWLQPLYFILASRSTVFFIAASSSRWLSFSLWSWLTRSSASASFLRNSGGTVGGVGVLWPNSSTVEGSAVDGGEGIDSIDASSSSFANFLE